MASVAKNITRHLNGTSASVFVPDEGGHYEAVHVPFDKGCLSEVYEIDENDHKEKVAQQPVKVTCESF